MSASVGLVVFGATGGSGAAIVSSYARRVGQPVLAVSHRLPEFALPPEATPIVCDALDRDAVARVIADAPDAVVVSVLGARRGQEPLVDDIGNRNVIDGAGAEQTVILVTSMGCGEPEGTIPPILVAKTRAEEHLRRSGRPYAIVRPGGLTTRPATSAASLFEEPCALGMITRADLAELVVDVVLDDTMRACTMAAVDRTIPFPPPPKA
jgi:uncharacterized protein YbjT (DUF2867 family)